MAAQITRTITTYKASAYKVVWKNGKPEAALVGEAVYQGSDSKTEARAALKNAGIECPRGTEVLIEKISETLYAMDVETFMEYAQPIERKVATA